MKITPTILAIPADEHSGSPLGLMPPGQWQMEQGGYHDPGDTEKFITRLWVECWETVGKLRKGKRLIIVNAGDAVEGLHHDSPEPWTMNIGEHERAHITAMELGMACADYGHPDDLLYYVKGTGAHVGPGGRSEENIAREFDGKGVVPMYPPDDARKKDGRFLWDHLRIKINGVRFDIAHHGASVGRLPWTSTTSLRTKLKELHFRSLQTGRPAPDYWIRADRHQYAHDIYVPRTGKPINGYVCPSFQSKTEFGKKVAADQLSDMGMLIFEISADGVVQDHSHVIQFDDTREEQV